MTELPSESERYRAPIGTYPPWMDPGYMLGASKVVSSTILTADANGLVIVPGNPRRWAVGMAASTAGLASSLAISDHADPQTYAFKRTDATGGLGVIWLTQFDYGPLVQYQLFVKANAGDTFRLWELEVW